jgi:ribose 1,5-bisphosphokinase
MGHGALVLVVGPSGVGKDTLIGKAREALAGNDRFVFPRRVVTRTAVAELEDHDTVEPAEFQKQKLLGAYALDWQAHGLSYALPASIEATMKAGGVVVANVSRAVIPRALQKYEDVHVLLIAARPEVREERLATRGRETAPDIAGRLAREGAAVPEGVKPVVVDNSGPLEVGLIAFVAALKALAR